MAHSEASTLPRPSRRHPLWHSVATSVARGLTRFQGRFLFRSLSQPRSVAHGLAFAILMVLGGCGPREAAQPLAIGINSWPGYEFARLAREKGYYEAEGVDVRLVELHGLSDVRRAYVRGQLDGMFSTLIEVLQSGQQSGRPPVVTLVTDYSDGADVVLARPELSGVRALRGRRVGLELASLNTYLLARALETVGMGLADVSLVNLPKNELATAIKEGRVDAVVTYPPESIHLEKALKLRRLFSSAEIPGEIPDVLSFDPEVLRNRGSEVRAALRAYSRAQAFARSHPDEARRIMAGQQNISVDEFKLALESGIKLVSVDEQSVFFEAGGPLRKAVEVSNQVLVSTHQLSAPVAVGAVIAPQPAL